MAGRDALSGKRAAEFGPRPRPRSYGSASGGGRRGARDWRRVSANRYGRGSAARRNSIRSRKGRRRRRGRRGSRSRRYRPNRRTAGRRPRRGPRSRGRPTDGRPRASAARSRRFQCGWPGTISTTDQSNVQCMALVPGKNTSSAMSSRALRPGGPSKVIGFLRRSTNWHCSSRNGRPPK